MTPRTHTRETQAREALLTLVNAGASHLPTIRSIASRTGLAYVTVWKAMDKLRREGVLTATPGRGMEAGRALSVTPSQPVASGSAKRWQSVRAVIEQDILSGRYEPGALLPSPKALRHALGVCHETLAAALAHLVRDRVLAPHKRTYRVALLYEGSARPRVALIARGRRDGNILLYSQRMQEMFRSLESECSRSGIALEVFPFDEDRAALYTSAGEPASTAAIRRAGALGLLLWTTGISMPNQQRLVAQFGRCSVPIAVLDESGDGSLDEALRQQSRLRVFPVGIGAMHGEVMGRYLLGLGHRHVAYVSPVHNTLWSRNRLHGLRQAFRAFGAANAVTAVTCETTAPSGRDLPAAFREMHHVVDHLMHYERVHRGSDATVIAEAVRVLGEQLDAVLEITLPRRELQPLLQKVLAEKAVTAIVGANDLIAAECLVFLTQHGRRVPHDYSVVGFDDTWREFQTGLTSYNFNYPAMARAMLGHVLRWRALRRVVAARPVIEMEGFVNGRRTSAARGKKS
jgi:DNA-binding LacI/PurR family transcriptional regulator/DNA-binding transcriptional regulator YhcF (GntR family)